MFAFTFNVLMDNLLLLLLLLRGFQKILFCKQDFWGHFNRDKNFNHFPSIVCFCFSIYSLITTTWICTKSLYHLIIHVLNTLIQWIKKFPCVLNHNLLNLTNKIYLERILQKKQIKLRISEEQLLKMHETRI